MSEETQKTIHAWATQTFGLLVDKGVAIQRMMQEVDELDYSSLHANTVSPSIIANECADVLIMLYQVASAFGFDLHEQVDHKMKINRSRTWDVKGDGTGQHIIQSETRLEDF